MWWLALAGVATSLIGQYNANREQAQGEIDNANFYRIQADFAKEAMFRQKDITAREYEYQRGQIVSAYAGGGIDVGSGSAATQIADAIYKKVSELDAVKRKGILDIQLAQARANSSQRQAQELNDPLNNLLQGGGTLMQSFASYKARS